MKEDRGVGGSSGSPRPILDDARLAGFLDREFDGFPGVLGEFPLLMGAQNRARRFAIEADGELIAHAAWRPLLLRSAGERVRGAGIGLVTTGRAWRGQGYARRVVRHCLDHARQEGAELALLFAPGRGLYDALGFQPAGQERITRLDPGAQGPEAKLRVGDPSHAGLLRGLLARHPLGAERSVEEFEALLAVPDTHLYLLEEGDRPLAYCVEGKGRDLRGVVHEWAGEPQDVARLLGALVQDLQHALHVLSPASQPTPCGGESEIHPLAQMLILAPERFGTVDAVAVFGSPADRPRIPLYLWGLDSF